MKKFTINCDFGGQMSPFTIFIGEPESEHHPLHFQADWLSKQRNGTIPSQVMDAIAKLKELADKNNVSLEELCVYALGSVGADESGVAAAGEGEVIAGQEEVTPDASSEQVLSTETIPTQESMDTVSMNTSSDEALQTEELVDSVAVDTVNNEALQTQEAEDIVEVQSNESIDNQAHAMDNVSAEEIVSDAMPISEAIATTETQTNQQLQEAADNIGVQEENIDNQVVDEVTVQENTNPLSEEQIVVADNNILPEQQNLVNTEQNEELVTTNEQQEAKIDSEKK